MRLELIETPDYVLAVSNEDASNSYIYFSGTPNGVFKTGEKYKNYNGDDFYKDAITGAANTYLAKITKKIIAHLPKDNEPELNLPLLFEMEDDVEKLANDLANKKGDNDLELEGYIYASFIEGYKAATKVYSEEDLRKAINIARDLYFKSYNVAEDEIIQSLKQPKTPK